MRRTALTSSVACLATLLASLVTTVVVGAASTFVVTAPARASGPDLDRPEVGSCHRLTLGEAGRETDPDRGVPCTTAHTSVTLAAPDKPAGLRWESDDLINWTATRCQKELIAFFGSRQKESLARSAYEFVFFYPTERERAQGATWVRCDVVLFGGRRLVGLPTDGAPRLGRVPDSVRLCLTDRRGTYLDTTCTRRHEYRSIATVRSGRSTFPTDAAWRRLGRLCPRGNDLFTWPGRAVYRAGFPFLVCYAETTR